MNILIDATGIAKEKAGVGVYAKNLLDHLTRAPGSLHYTILAQDDDREMDFGDRPQVTMLWVPARWFRRLPMRVLLEQLALPFLLWKRRIAVVHSLHYAFPLLTFGAKRVVTFHDITFITMPEVHERVKVRYFGVFMRASVRRAEAVLFISRSALADYTTTLGAPRGTAWVVEHGKGEAFRPDISNAEKNNVRRIYGLGSKFVLYIGTIEPRKNLTRLVEAFAAIAANDAEIQLVIAGKRGWMTEGLFRRVAALGLGPRVIFTGFVAEQDKPALLAACTVFVYPSLYEGFGLPALEALACGAPTITSNTSSLPEVVGDAAVLVDPASTQALTEAIARLLASPQLRDGLRRGGPKQAARFTWERTAERTAAVYRSLLPGERSDP